MDIYEFDEKRVESVCNSIEKDNKGTGNLQSVDALSHRTAEFAVLAECISVTVENGKVCIKLPLNLGKECINVPDWIPDGEAAKACLSIVYKRVLGVKIPVGVKVCLYVANQEITCVNFSL